MYGDMTYSQLKSKADAFRTLFGNTKPAYIDGPPPWHLAESCEPGGSHRLDISTSVRFYGTDPETGLKLTWCFDIEDRGANGSTSYQIDAEACRCVVRALRGEARGQFRAYLRECSEKVRVRGEEFRKAADKQATDAAILSDLAATDTTLAVAERI